jgi:hypothetical protein
MEVEEVVGVGEGGEGADDGKRRRR